MTYLLSHHHRTVLWGALTVYSHLALLKMMPLSAGGFVARSYAVSDRGRSDLTGSRDRSGSSERVDKEIELIAVSEQGRSQDHGLQDII